MEDSKIYFGKTSGNQPSLKRKLKQMLNYPSTFIVLVWMFLLLVFYLVTKFI